MLKRARKTPLLDEKRDNTPSAAKQHKEVPLPLKVKQQKRVPPSSEETTKENDTENSGANSPENKKVAEKAQKQKRVPKKKVPLKKKSGDVKREEKVIEPEIIGRAEEDISPKDKRVSGEV